MKDDQSGAGGDAQADIAALRKEVELRGKRIAEQREQIAVRDKKLAEQARILHEAQAEAVELRLAVEAAEDAAERAAKVPEGDADALARDLAAAQTALAEEQDARAELESRLSFAEAHIAAVERSASWRLTAPIRAITGLLRRG